MQYVLLIYQGATPLPGTPAWDRLSQEEQQKVYADYGALNSTPGVTPGPPLCLPENATTVRVEKGKTVTRRGPFAEGKNHVGGYLILEAADLNGALEVASRIPAARLGGAIEIRPVEKNW